MGSSRKDANKILVDRGRVERFFTKLANRDVIDEGFAERIRDIYPEMAEPFGASIGTWVRAVYWVQYFLRRAWLAPTAREREWHIYSMRQQYRLLTIEASYQEPIINSLVTGANPGPVEILEMPGGGLNHSRIDPRFIDMPNTPFDLAAFCFQSRVGHFAKRCGYEFCKEPYFIADKGWQKFCSEACAGPANRESKRKYWHNNKQKIRKTRKAQ